MQKLQFSYIFKLLLFILVNLSFVHVFYTIFEIDVESKVYSYFHAIMSGILIYQIERRINRKNSLSIGFLLIFVLCMYFQFSIIKYCRVGVFYGFSKNNRVRFQGTIIVFCVLFVINIIQKFVKNDLNFCFEFENKPSGYRLWTWIISFFLILYFGIFYNYTNTIYTNINYKSQSILITIVINIVICTGIYLSAYYFNFRRPITMLPIIIDIICITYYAMKTGSRANFFSYMFLVMFIYIEGKIIKRTWLVISQLVAPWFMIGFTYFTFIISGRYSNNLSQTVAMNIAYRFDLSDLAINILSNTNWLRFDLSELSAGLQNCIPSFLTNQYKGFYAYQNMLLSAGLIPSVDYSDTFFSMGASAGGIFGMILIIPILFGIYEFIDSLIARYGKKGILIKMICILTLTRIEIEWTSFIPQIRNLIISLVIMAIIYKVITIEYYWGGEKI